MQNLLTSAQMQMVDRHTIANKPIASIDLMENAARAFVQAFIQKEFDRNKYISIFCGKGNNGGDGLAIAHLLVNNGFKNVMVYVLNFGDKQREDFTINLQRLDESSCKKIVINHGDELKKIKTDLVIDAILGSGLNKPLEGEYEKIAQFINNLNARVYAVDVPTGFFAEGELSSEYNGVRAFKTICFQRPKINFFFPESAIATELFEVVPIGLDETFIEKQESNFGLTEERDIQHILKPRKLFSHKGTYGHALIIAGNTNTMGAALLASSSCLHSGAGLITACIPQSGLIALNSSLPEVMALPRDEYTRIEDPSKFKCIAIGPGLGTSSAEEKLLESLVSSRIPLVIDADAINLLANRQDLIAQLFPGTVLTPHVNEFDRLFGEHISWRARVETARLKVLELGVVIVLKNQFTFVCAPDGKVYVNPTGNPAMAQGGMGDVLTGIITSFVAQGYSATEASIMACYIHGKAGDTLSEHQVVVTASQIAGQIAIELKSVISKCFK